MPRPSSNIEPPRDDHLWDSHLVGCGGFIFLSLLCMGVFGSFIDRNPPKKQMPIANADQEPSVPPVIAPPPVPVPSKEPEFTPEGQRFVLEKLAELDSFKGDPQFHELGFAVAGPFNKWLIAIEDGQDKKQFALTERIAVGDLMMMGFSYMKSKGEETKHTQFARAEIMKVLRNSESPAPKLVPIPVSLPVAPEPRAIDPSTPPPTAAFVTEWKRVSTIETRVIGVLVGSAPLTTRDGKPFLTPVPVLRVWVETRAVDTMRESLRRWSGFHEPAVMFAASTRLLKPTLPSGTVIRGELVGSVKMKPGDPPISDVLLFQVPPTGSRLTLTLEGKHVDDSGLMTHVIPAAEWDNRGGQPNP